MSVIATKEFWEATAERAIKTFAQSVLAVWTAGATTPLDIDWKNTLLTALYATAASVLMSVVSAGIGKNEGPSLTSESLIPATGPVTGVVNPPPPAV